MQAAHHIHRLRQRGGLAVMEVRIGQRHIAQRRHLEVETVGVLARHPGPALGLVVGLVGLDEPHLLE
ncbi:hypothetical protein D3C71_2054400 [compost metagenome]